MNITEDGTKELKSISGAPNTGVSAVYFSGTLGAATVKLVYVDDDEEQIDLNNGAITTLPTDFEVRHGVGVPIWVSVTGADGDTDINCKRSIIKE